MAKKAIGTLLKIGANAIAELTSIGGLSLSADTIDVTTLDSPTGYRDFMQGLKDGGEVSVEGFFNPDDTNGQIALYNSFDAGTMLAYSMIFPASLNNVEWDFNAIVTAIETEASLEDAVPFKATLKVSGKPALGLTPSANLTALAITGTGGSLAPIFGATRYAYTYSGLTAASFTVTATGTGALKLYVNGVFKENLTSGTASSAIAIAANEVADVMVTHQEPGKTIKVYTVRVVKAA
jgi:predicted secreted protein